MSELREQIKEEAPESQNSGSELPYRGKLHDNDKYEITKHPTYEIKYEITKYGDFVQTRVPTLNIPLFNQTLNSDKKPGDDA